MLPKALYNLITELSSLPGVGPRSAQRIALAILDGDEAHARDLATALKVIHQEVKYCIICANWSEAEECSVCQDPTRDHTQILVVEQPIDVISFLNTDYNGLVHVLGGLISPLLGRGPEDISVEMLCSRVTKNTQELIVATSTSLEGDATANYISQKVREKRPDLKISRLAKGLPANISIDVMDPRTLSDSFLNRVEQ